MVATADRNIGVIRCICDRVAPIYRGVIVEEGPATQVLDNPHSDYAKTLLAAVPEPDPDHSLFADADSGRDFDMGSADGWH